MAKLENITMARQQHTSTAKSGNAKAVYDQLRRDIIHFAFKPGERLQEAKLSARYSVSRTPVREALRRLQQEQLVEFKGHHGCFVPHFDVNAYAHVYRVRIALEKLSVCEAAKRAAAFDVEALRREWLAGYNGGTEAQDGSYVSANEAYHIGLARLSRNEYLAGLLKQIFDRTRIIAIVDFTTRERIEATRREHDEILDAVAAGDAERAEELVERHIEMSKSNIRRLIAKALEGIYLGEGDEV